MIGTVVEKKGIIFFMMLFLHTSNLLFSQNGNSEFAIWKLQSLKGKISIGGEYRQLFTRLQSGFEEKLNSNFVNSDIQLFSESSIIHPRFLTMDVHAEYNPSSLKSAYLIIPERTETSTAEKAGVQFSILNPFPFSALGFGNYLHAYISREALTDVETYQKNYGGMLRWRNTFIPSFISYRFDNSKQKELQTGRLLLNLQHNIVADMRTSLSAHDQQHLWYNYDNQQVQYFTQDTVHYKVSSINFESAVSFDSSGQGLLNTHAIYEIRRNHLDYNRLELNENLNYRLPYNFTSLADYRYMSYKQDRTSWNQHVVSAILSHQLFASLRSILTINLINGHHSDFDETIKEGVLGFNYVKEIPFGTLRLAYQYRLRDERRQSISEYLTITNEEYQLDDAQIVLLRNPYAMWNTINVSNQSQSIIYQENLDYTLIHQGEFTQIRRQPGGQIPNGSTIKINYQSLTNPSYNFRTAGKNAECGVLLFDKLFDVYFSYSDQSSKDSDIELVKKLNLFRQRKAGVRLMYNLIQLGVEFDDMASNILPYFSRRIYGNASQRLFSALEFSISGSMTDLMLKNENDNQKHQNASGKILYQFSDGVSLSIEGHYMFQRMKQLELDYRLVKSEFTFPIRFIRFSIGGEWYRQILEKEKREFARGYIKIERTF